MARAIWTGALAFGLVNVPVGLYSATQDQTIHFRQFEKGTSSKIRYRRVNEDTGNEVPYENIVKGYELDSGDYVLLEPEELDEIAPGKSRTIDITDFVEASEIDPIYYQKSYYLAPENDAAKRPYALLADAMEQAGRIAIANFVMRSKQYLAAVRPDNGVLVLETMFFANEVRQPSEQLDNLPGRTQPAKKDVEVAVSLIESMTTEWDPDNYSDTYRDKVLELVQAKAGGQEVVAPSEPAEEGGDVVDLTDALRRSVEAARSKRRPGNKDQAGDLEVRDPDAEQGTDDADEADLTAKSKDELYDLAGELGVAGRSKMTKKELADAITDARGSRSGRSSRSSGKSSRKKAS